MPYCKNCGARLPEDAIYCPNCGAPIPLEAYVPKLELASWGERVAAYLIDIIILAVVLIPLMWLFSWSWMYMMPIFNLRLFWVNFVSFGFSNLISFLYWTFMDGVYGQSLGKMALRIKVSNLEGKSIDITSAAIESLGKAFLLPIDLILGLILYPQKNQRLFNYISNTVVIKVYR